jgi:hypothetical protein
MSARFPFAALQHSALCAAAIATGCGGGGADRCDRDEDCASGFCRADGTCAPAEADADPTAPDADPSAPDADPSGCVPDHDGVIARDEVPLAAGVSASFRVALDATVSTAGTQLPSGQREWSLTAALAGDADREVVLAAPGDAWWAEAFPGASYATALSAGSDLLGVFSIDDTRVRLLGVVSPDAGVTRTEIAYDPPVDVLRIPLATDAAWTTETTASGVVSGVIAAYTERYVNAVDAVGTMTTPYGEFPVVRIGVDFRQTLGAVVTTRRSYAFVAECFGTVATIVSQDYEPDDEFTDAAEVRRIIP